MTQLKAVEVWIVSRLAKKLQPYMEPTTTIRDCIIENNSGGSGVHISPDGAFFPRGVNMRGRVHAIADDGCETCRKARPWRTEIPEVLLVDPGQLSFDQVQREKETQCQT